MTLERLKEIGISGVILAVKYMAEVFMKHYSEKNHGLSILYSIEKKPMRTGGAIKYAEQLIGHEEPFLVLNGDIFSTIDYNALVKKHKETKAAATIALYRVEDPRRYGTVKVSNGNKITQFIEKAPLGQTPSNLINAGIYILNPEILDYIPADRPISIEHEVFPKLAEEGKLFGQEFKEIWIDIGKPLDYLKANQLLLDAEKGKRLLGKGTNVADGARIREPIQCDINVTIGQYSKLGPYVVIGKGTVLGKNVRIENSVIFPHALIEDNASVTGAIIGEGAIIGSGATISEGCVIGDYVSISDNVTVSRDVTVCHSKEVKDNIPESMRII